jgi:hypothetical protein
MRTLREGKNEFTCMIRGTDKMCNDRNSMEFMNALMKHAAPPDKVGISYLLAGDHGASNTDPYATGKTASNHWVVTGPNIMVFGPPSKTLGYTKAADPDPNKPYMMWAGTPMNTRGFQLLLRSEPYLRTALANISQLEKPSCPGLFLCGEVTWKKRI